jgi:hypothetical protein
MLRYLAIGLLAATPAFAQHGITAGGPYNAAVPTPKAVLGYDIGDRFTPHHLIVRYAERLAAASRRVHIDTVATTFEGRPLLLATITNEANQARRDRIREDARRLADPATSSSDVDAIIARSPAVIWLGYSVHGDEASGTEAALAFMYQLAAGDDATTKMLIDSLVILIDPIQNPDGHERHVQQTNQTRSALWIPPTPAAMIHQTVWPGPRTSHYHFDLNRDWYLLSHPESRGRIATFLSWYPQTAADIHEMGYNATYYFAPPMDPVNKNIGQNIRDWWDIYAAANAAAFDTHGWPFFRREGYDDFYPGYGDSWPTFIGAVGMTYEQASSEGGAIRREDGTILTLKDAITHHYAASWATALTTAQRRTQRMRDFNAFRRAAVTDAQRHPVRGIVFARDAHGRADSLAQRLMQNGIVVQRARDAVEGNPFPHTTGSRAPAGSYVVDFAQGNGVLARALLEPDAQLDSTFIREELENRESGQEARFYDVTAWAMPYTFRVDAWTLRAPPGNLVSVGTQRSAPAIPSRARVAYAFAPGSEASIRMLAGLLTDSVRVHVAQRSFRNAGRDFPGGAFIVRVSANNDRVHEKVAAHAARSGADVAAINSSAAERGTDLGSGSVLPIRAPRVALVGGNGVSPTSFGFAWYQLDQRMHFPVTSINAAALGGETIDEFNVIVLPSTAGLDGVLNEAGRSKLGAWVRNGGVLITLDGATTWVATEKLGIARLRARVDSVRADSLPGAPLPADVPGAIVRVQADTLSLLTLGVDERILPALVFSDRIYTTPKDVRPGELVLRVAPASQLRIAGYLWPEAPARLASTPYLWTESVGRGRLIAFAGEPNFRDMWRGMLPIFANAVLLGGSF